MEGEGTSAVEAMLRGDSAGGGGGDASHMPPTDAEQKEATPEAAQRRAAIEAECREVNAECCCCCYLHQRLSEETTLPSHTSVISRLCLKGQREQHALDPFQR